MQLIRIFSTDKYKGSKNYLNSQKKYEIIRTLLYFGISISLFVAGYIQTGRKANLLTIVAVLGCLPASKSAVSVIMFLRFKSCGADAASEIEKHCQGLHVLYDMVFTSYQKNYVISHLAVQGNTVCGYSEKPDFQENDYYKHIDNILKMDGLKDVTVKVFTDLKKYTNRLEQMKDLEADEGRTDSVIATLKSVAL
ncbi:MAG: hypothetical protein K2P59_06755 [Acetatifactor sp.]|jgi:hypothetical protein|nr:hypothetical protein [Acetatifactor sp.]